MPFVEFTSNGTWTWPDNLDVRMVHVEVWAPGAGGAGGGGSNYEGGTGGYGGQHASAYVEGTPGEVFDVIVDPPGLGGGPSEGGGAAGDASFGRPGEDVIVKAHGYNGGSVIFWGYDPGGHPSNYPLHIGENGNKGGMPELGYGLDPLNGGTGGGGGGGTREMGGFGNANTGGAGGLLGGGAGGDGSVARDGDGYPGAFPGGGGGGGTGKKGAGGDGALGVVRITYEEFDGTNPLDYDWGRNSHLVPSSAVLCRVDTDASTSPHYTSISAAIAGETSASPQVVSGLNLSDNKETLVIDCFASSAAADAIGLDRPGTDLFVTDAVHTVIYKGGKGHEAGRLWDQNKFRTYRLRLYENHRVIGLQISPYINDSIWYVLQLYGEKCFAINNHLLETDTYNHDGIEYTSSKKSWIVGNIVENFQLNGLYASNSVDEQRDYVLFNTVVRSRYSGISVYQDRIVAGNLLFESEGVDGDGDIDEHSFADHGDICYNGTSDATGSIWNDGLYDLLYDDIFVDFENDDYRPRTGSVVLSAVGTYVYGINGFDLDTALRQNKGVFAYDIAGDARPFFLDTPATMGALQVPAEGASLPPLEISRIREETGTTDWRDAWHTSDIYLRASNEIYIAPKRFSKIFVYHYDGATYDWRQTNLYDLLQDLGHYVTISDTLPPDLSDYDWIIIPQDAAFSFYPDPIPNIATLQNSGCSIISFCARGAGDVLGMTDGSFNSVGTSYRRFWESFDSTWSALAPLGATFNFTFPEEDLQWESRTIDNGDIIEANNVISRWFDRTYYRSLSGKYYIFLGYQHWLQWLRDDYFPNKLVQLLLHCLELRSADEGYWPSGYRVSKPLAIDEGCADGQDLLRTMHEITGSSIQWTANVPTDAGLGIECAVNDSPDIEPDSQDYVAATNGGSIPGITAGIIPAGKYLWVRQSFTVSTSDETPVLSSLTVQIDGLHEREPFTGTLEVFPAPIYYQGFPGISLPEVVTVTPAQLICSGLVNISRKVQGTGRINMRGSTAIKALLAVPWAIAEYEGFPAEITATGSNAVDVPFAVAEYWGIVPSVSYALVAETQIAIAEYQGMAVSGNTARNTFTVYQSIITVPSPPTTVSHTLFGGIMAFSMQLLSQSMGVRKRSALLGQVGTSLSMRNKHINTLSGLSVSVQNQIIGALVDTNDVHNFQQVTTMLDDPSAQYFPTAAEVYLDGRPLSGRCTEVEISYDENNVHNEIIIQSADPDLFSWGDPEIRYGNPRIEAQVGGRSISFLLELREGEESNFVLSGRDVTALEGEPYAVDIDFQPEEPAKASSLAAGFAEYTAVDWQAGDWVVPLEFEFSGKPIDGIQKLAAEIGAIVRAQDDGSLLVRDRYPVRPVDMGTKTAGVDYSRDNLISLGHSVVQESGYNAVTVLGRTHEVFTPQLKLEETSPLMGQDVHVQCYWAGHSFEAVDSYVSSGEIISEGHFTDIIEEPVAFTAGSAAVNLPVEELLDVSWTGGPGGSVSFDRHGTELSIPDGGFGVATVKYRTKYERFLLSEHFVERLIAVLYLSTIPDVYVDVRTSASPVYAPPIEAPLLTTEDAAVARGRAWIDSNKYRLDALDIEAPYNSGAVDGSLAYINDAAIGEQGNYHIEAASILIDGPKITNRIRMRKCLVF